MPLPSVDIERGRSYVDLLADRDWVARTVDAVVLHDHRTATRHLTFDIKGDGAVREVAHHLATFNGRPLVPIAVLQKDLLFDFDLRDGSRNALPLVPREVDSAVSLNIMAHVCDLLRPDEVLLDGCARQIYSIIHAFPRSAEVNLQTPAWMTGDEGSQWEELKNEETFRSYMQFFHESFLLLAPVSTDAEIQLVKMSYRAPIDPGGDTLGQRLALSPLTVSVPVPGLWDTRSYHLRFRAPTGLEITSARLVPTGMQDPGAPADVRLP